MANGPKQEVSISSLAKLLLNIRFHKDDLFGLFLSSEQKRSFVLYF